MLKKNLIIITSIFAIFGSANAQDGLAKLYSAKGSVEKKTASASLWKPVAKGAEFANQDEVKTGPASRAGLKFSGGKLVRLRENSQLKIEDPDAAKEGGGKLNILSGAMYLFSRQTQKFPEIDTPEVSAAIRGTEVVIEVKDKETKVTVINGSVELKNQYGAAKLGSGEEASVKRGSPPLKRLAVNPRDSVQWAFSYPLIVDSADFKDPKVSKVLEAIANNNPAAALKELNSINGFNLEAEVLKGAVSLSVGNIDAAQHSVAAVRKNSSSLSAPLKAHIYSQEAVLALLSNDDAKADSSSLAAVDADTKSITAHVARAYVLQSQRDLAGARDILLKALEVDPNNPEVLARLAEAYLGEGRLGEARDLARRAVDQAPGHAYANSVLGYAHLTRRETEQARTYFEKAIKADDSSGLPFLGMGLAKISEGDLEEGRADIEKAVSIEPSTSIYRSYLGKAFFEEEREDLAQDEYGLAIEIDPNDPTPYLYRAFNQLSKNRPVHALNDVEESIALNENRAVFRSDLLMDQDLAVRGTSLAEAFGQLGFSQVARLEAIKSINKDYSNYSAHRLYADSFDGFFFADAKFSENVIANLMAPVSFNVFSGLNGFSGEASLNEYSALFDRDQHRTGINGSASTKDSRLFGSVFQTGKEGKFGYYLGASGDYAKGGKSNGIYQRDYRFEAAAQYQIDFENRLIAQTAFIRRDDFDTELEDELKDFEVSLGSHHRLGVGSKIITRFEYLDRKFDTFEGFVSRDAMEALVLDTGTTMFTDEEILVDESTDENITTLRASAQYIFDSTWLSLVAGGEFLNADGDSTEDSLLLEDSVGIYTDLDVPLSSMADYTTDSYSAYLYSTLHAAKWIDINAGVNFTEIELPAYDVIPPFVDGSRTKDKWSPKAGFTIYPDKSWIIRGAYFQDLGISNESDIGSIEPTLVGGFNQVFGDLPGAETETLGIGADWKLAKQFYAGAEYMNRDIERDQVNISNSLTANFVTLMDEFSLKSSSLLEEEQEDLYKAYFYSVLSDDITATVDFVKSDLEAKDIGEEVDTDRVQFALNYFSPQRWFAFTRANYVHQDLVGVDEFDSVSAFWQFDAGIGYRIPKRHGAVRLVFANIFDENFRYEDRGRQTTIEDEFTVRLEASYNF